MKQVLVSGIKPSGRLHVGNYLGALKNWVELQNSGKYDCYFFLADLHAITEPQDPKELQENIKNLAADFLAAGIDPEKSIIFQQSRLPAHSELAWILNTITPMGELRRMTQFKEKSESQDNENAGLFGYPVLQAADVLMYDAAVIPVGDDQLQHLELARTLARKFNSRFGDTFIEPNGLLTKTPRVMSLRDPEKKMSKSSPDGCIFLDDEPEAIEQKLARATTDSGSEISYDPVNKAGVANLLEIYAGIKNIKPESAATEFSGQGYAALKGAVARALVEHLSDFRATKKKLVADPATIEKILKEGSEKAAAVAMKKIEEVKKKVGF